ncbi:hypothetical protein TTRE_0000409301 [Trichuris trichiura]|uniref:Uncharacterized protein n=1 Tax=Trichuris trichiura TaxID=36087 RepID=A0A077ZAX9_TRITR|nr:hypothetical protein TTRE_0000409301 [Trichuris trichiura]
MSTAKQEVENRKILEEIKQQKRQLMLKNPHLATSTLASSSPSSIGNIQRQAAMRAAANSCASIMYVESLYKNNILLVVPRMQQGVLEAGGRI